MQALQIQNTNGIHLFNLLRKQQNFGVLLFAAARASWIHEISSFIRELEYKNYEKSIYNICAPFYNSRYNESDMGGTRSVVMSIKATRRPFRKHTHSGSKNTQPIQYPEVNKHLCCRDGAAVRGPFSTDNDKLATSRAAAVAEVTSRAVHHW